MLNTAIKEKDGALWFDIEGELYSPYAYMTYCPEKKYIDEFKKAGYKIFSFPVYMCDWSINAETGLKPFWQSVIQSDGSYDFSCVDKFLEMFSPGGNDGFIFPRVFLQTPSFWDSDNPEELFCDYGGERIRCDFTSEKAREFLWKAFKALIDHIEDSPWKNSVIGYQIAPATEKRSATVSTARFALSLMPLKPAAKHPFLHPKYSTTRQLLTTL